MVSRFSEAVLTGAFCAVVACAAPNAFARWTAAGPFGGNAEVIASTAADPNLLVSGTKNANLFLSRDAGENWQPLRFPRQYSSMLHTIVIDPKHSSTFYAAIADEPRAGLYRTTDSGKTWSAVDGLGNEEVYSLAIWSGDSKVMAAGLRHSVRLSKDGGVTWRSITPDDNIELQPAVSVAFDPDNVDVIYVGTPRLPWKTADGGSNWNMAAEGMSTDSDIITVRVDADRPSRVFIGACSGFWRSTNGGEFWSKMSGIPFTSRRTYAFVQDPERSETIFAGTSRGLYRTLDGGTNWRVIAPHEIKSLAMAGGALYIATADAGLFKSTDEGVTLRPINRGFTSRNFARIAEAGEHLYTGTGFETDAGAVFVSSDGARHWELVADPARLGNESVTAIVRTAGSSLVAATPSATFRSTDLGKTWNRIKSAPTRVTAFLSLEGALLAGAEAGFFRSTDDGLTWKQIGRDPVRGLMRSESIVALLQHEIVISGDEGKTWQRRHLPFFTDVYDVAVAGGTLIAGTSRGVFHSEDAGETWRSARSGLPTASITAVAMDPRSPNVAFAFEYGNFYRSEDGGVTWVRFDQDGLGGAFVRNLMVTRQGPHHLVAVTATRGIFVRDIDGSNGTPNDFSAVEIRKDGYGSNQQNDKTPAL